MKSLRELMTKKFFPFVWSGSCWREQFQIARRLCQALTLCCIKSKVASASHSQTEFVLNR